MKQALAVLFVVCIASPAFASPGKEHDHSAMKPKTNESFEQMKKLIGTWEGTSKMGGKEEKVTATYELTSGGNAILEKLMAGTPHEMVSIYHPEGKTVAMTHYCMVGNQPKMVMKTSTPTSVAFEMKGASGIGSKKEMHMHAVDIKW